MRIFPNREACLRLVTALAVETSEEWLTGRRYLDIEELKQERSREEAGGEVVFTDRREGTFRPISPSLYRPNPRSERCTNPFSDGFGR